MPSFLRSAGAISLAFSCLLTAHAHKASVINASLCTQGMVGCGLAFETPVESVPTLTTTTTGQTSYTITNQGDSTVNIALSLQELDSLGDSGAITFDETTTCPMPGTIASDATCIIVLDFQPTLPGNLSWTLTVTPSGSSTSQLPLVLPLQTTVTGSAPPIATAAGSISTDGSNTYPLLAVSTNGGSAWDYVIDASTSPLPYNYDASNGDSFFIVNCATAYCAGGGQYMIGDVQYPFAASNGGDESWAYTFDYNTIQTYITDDSLDYGTGGDFGAAYCIEDVCMLGGTYWNSENNVYPLLVTSVGGGDWELSVSETMYSPSDLASNPEAEINSIACTGSNCVMVGIYINSDASEMPLLAYTSDNGSTWTYPSLTFLPGDFNEGSLISVSCNGDNCVAAGVYSDGDVVIPMVFSSFDQGETWSLTIDSTSSAIPSDWTENNGFVPSASCSDTACAIVGFYPSDDSGNQYPYMAIAVYTDEFPCTNASNCNWVDAIDSSTNTLSDISSDGGEFVSVACSETTCVGAGYYVSSNDGNEYPFIATLDLSDSSVTYPVDQTSISTTMTDDGTPPDYYLNSNSGTGFYGNSCTGTFCTAAGQYTSAANTSNAYPFLMTSNDSGSTWSYTVDGSSSFPTPFASGGFFSDNIGQELLKK